MNKIQQFFIHRHDIYCNQKYADGLPYSFHLKMVNAQAIKFKKYIPVDEPYYTAVQIGIWGHDAIEDTRMTYNDIVNLNDILQLQHINNLTLLQAQQACKLGANIIYACTENRGRNRTERHDGLYFRTLMHDRDAVFAKLCDVIANVKFSLLENSSMFEKYKKEWVVFKEWLKTSNVGRENYLVEFPDMIDHLEQLFLIN